jgi:hypothetical protein
MIKLPTTTLDMRLKTATLLQFFPKEMAFVAANAYQFIGQRPEVLAALNTDGGMPIAMLLSLTEQMEQQAQAAAAQREVDERMAKYDADTAAAKARSGLALTQGHVRQ